MSIFISSSVLVGQVGSGDSNRDSKKSFLGESEQKPLLSVNCLRFKAIEMSFSWFTHAEAEAGRIDINLGFPSPLFFIICMRVLPICMYVPHHAIFCLIIFRDRFFPYSLDSS